MTATRVLLLLIMLGVIIPAAGQQNSPPPTQLALEIKYYPNEPPGYQNVAAGRRSGGWWSRFATVPGWKQPADGLPVHSVDIRSELAEDGVRVWVSVYLGRMREQEKSITSYILHVGEKRIVSELAELGVVPFEIKLIRVDLQALELPHFRSKAKSIELVVIQPKLETIPAFEVAVRNVSGKNVIALSQKVFQSGHEEISSMPQGKEGRPLISPGGTTLLTAPIATRATPTADGYEPKVLPDQTIEIATAMFDDGSFEGDPKPAISFYGFQKGRSIQLSRAIALLNKAFAADDSVATNIEALRTEIAALNFEAASDDLQNLRNQFPAIADTELKRPVEISMKGMRDEILRDFDQYQLRRRRFPTPAAREWLAATIQRYQAWLGRL